MPDVDQQIAEVLVVDDDYDVLAGVCAALEQHGLATDTAGNGKEALLKLCARTVEDRLYDAVIVDIMMPILDGWQVLHALKNNPLWKAINVVVLTGTADTPQEIARVTDYDGVFVRKKEGFIDVVGDLVERIVPPQAD
jgi:CheY-like chemotaxis protein